MGNDMTTIDNDMDNLVSAFNDDDTATFMELTGQAKATSSNTGLSRLNINYDTETDDGVALTRGSWKMFVDGEYIYAKEVYIRPILRTFEWSVWDMEQGTFSCKSVQKPTLSGEFPDTQAGNKCGRLPKKEEEILSDDDPLKLKSRSATCNQVIYGQVSGDFVKANGDPAKMDNHPFVAYFKRSGFKPIREFIDGLTRQKKIMQKVVIKLATGRVKSGSVVYYIPVPSLHKEVEVLDTDKTLMKDFSETVKAHNENVLNQFREAQKLISPSEEQDLSADFNVKSA
jgi:hypothetical protein|tara:strand:- start:730 stop:1584 length:855 start_codon:yes stop_codon:yes gene_type:complete